MNDNAMKPWYNVPQVTLDLLADRMRFSERHVTIQRIVKRNCPTGTDRVDLHVVTRTRVPQIDDQAADRLSNPICRQPPGAW